MKIKFFFTSIILLSLFVMGSQNQSHANETKTPVNLFVFNAGDPANDYSSIGVVDLINGSYSEIEEIEVGNPGAASIIIDESYVYLGSGDVLAKYDLETRTRVEFRDDLGSVNHIAFYDEYIVVSRNSGTNPLALYRKDDLSEVHVFSEVSEAVSGIAVSGDSLYASFPTQNISEGALGIFDLVNRTKVARLELGPEGDQLRDLHVDEHYVYGISRARSIAVNEYAMKYEIATRTTDFLGVPPNQQGQAVFTGAWGIHGGVFYVTMHGNLASLDMENMDYFMTHIFSGNIGSAVVDISRDAFDAELYVGETDFMTWGEIQHISEYGNDIASFSSGIYPNAMAIEYETISLFVTLAEGEGSTGRFRGGDQSEPDYLCMNEQLEYVIVPPDGLDQSGYGTTWQIANLLVLSEGGIAQDYDYNEPTTSEEGTITIRATEGEQDEDYFTIVIDVHNISQNLYGEVRRMYEVLTIPTAHFTFEHGTEGMVQFTDSSYIASGEVAGWHWEFDGEGTSEEANPEFTFAESGTYAISLTVESNMGCFSETATEDVEVILTSLFAEADADVAISVYPNPISREATVSYSLAQSGSVRVQLFDLSGKNAATLTESYVSAGNNELTLRPAELGLTPGMYILRLETAEYTTTEMIRFEN